MSNRDNGSELDYYELRKRHQEYKARARVAQPAEPASKPNPVPAPDSITRPEEPLHADEIKGTTVDVPVAASADIPASKPADTPIPEFIDTPARESDEADPLASFVLSDDESYEDDMDYEEDQGDANPNPFDSFIRFFHGVKDNISARRQAQEEEEFDALDDDLTDEELAELEAEEERKRSRLFRRKAEGSSEDEILDSDLDEFDDEDFEDDDFEEDDDDRRPSGFKRFLNLFVTRVDEDEESEDAFDDLEPVSKHRNRHSREIEILRDDLHGAHRKPEGGQNMDEMNKLVSEPIKQMAEGLETSGMSRRERRELAMRLAAEEAARKAGEEASLRVESAPQAEEIVFPENDPISAASTLKPLFTDDIPASATDVDSVPAEFAVDEPTREFTPVSLRSLDEDKHAIFAVDSEGEDSEDEDDNEDEDKDDTPRKGLFSRLRGRNRDEDEDEDEDEEDDEEDEDDYDDDEDEDEDDEPSSKFRLFGRRKKVEDDDEDDEEDDDEDEDDYDDDEEDEDDEYDEYEDDEEDEYDDYDDDEGDHRSIGYHIIGVFKWVLRIIFVLLVCVIILNFLYVTGHDTIVPTMHDAMGDSTAFHLLFFGYDVRQLRQPAEVAEPDIPEEVADPAEEAEAIPDPEAAISIPDLDSNGEITESPVVDVAPVSEGNEGTVAGGSIG